MIISKQIGQLFSLLIGAIIMSAYFLFESMIFGLVFWFFWNMFNIGLFLGLGMITYFQATGILFILKILRFDSSKIGKSIPIITPKE